MRLLTLVAAGLLLAGCDLPLPRPVRFEVKTNVATRGYAQDIWIDGERAYIADGQAGLAVFDISDPESPTLLGYVTDSQNEAYGVVAADSYAYVAYGYKELLIARVGNPDSLRIVGELEYPQPGYGFDAALRDSFVYIAADAQLIVVDARDPAFPNLVFQERYPRGCRGVALDRDRCYLAIEQIGVSVWDISSLPPTEVASFDTPSNARSVAIADGHLFVADGREGLLVIDPTAPESTAILATLALPGYAERISVQDTLVFVGCRSAGVAVVSVAEPGAPVLVAEVKTEYARAAMASGRYVYACDRDMGLVVIEMKE